MVHFRGNIIGRVTGIGLFAHKFLEVSPNETIRDEEVESVCEDIVHEGMKRRRKATECVKIHVEGVARIRTIPEDGDKVARVAGGFESAGAVESGARNFRSRYLGERMLHYGTHGELHLS